MPFLEEKSDIELEIEYLKKWKETTDNELDLLFEKALANTREMISVLGSTPHPLVSYLMRILRTPDDFISISCTDAGFIQPDKVKRTDFHRACRRILKSELYSTILKMKKKDRGRVSSILRLLISEIHGKTHRKSMRRRKRITAVPRKSHMIMKKQLQRPDGSLKLPCTMAMS